MTNKQAYEAKMKEASKYNGHLGVEEYKTMYLEVIAEALCVIADELHELNERKE